MFQKHSIMSLKKKSKSLGHLTGLGSPNFGSPRMKKQISQKSFNAERLRVLNHGYGGDSGQQQQNGYAQQQRVPPTRSTTALHLGTPQQQQQMMLSQQAGTNSPQQQQQPARSGIVKATTPKVGSRKTVFCE